MYKKYGLFLFWALIAAMPAQAIKISSEGKTLWGYTDRNVSGSLATSDFFLAGGVGKSAQTRGTWSDEYGGVAAIAVDFAEHGAKFCPYQIQCANKRKEKKTWTMYYFPMINKKAVTSIKDRCVWLCDDGYSGEGCKTAPAEVTRCDTTPLSGVSGARFAGLSMKTGTKSTDQREAEVFGFDQWGGGKQGNKSGKNTGEADVLLAITKFVEHGVWAQPVKVLCERDNWKEIDSYIKSIDEASGQKKLLCAEGYKPNESKSECVMVNGSICEISEKIEENLSFCGGFDKTKYDNAVHYMETVDGCVKYFCIDDNMAFASTTDTTCTECATGVKGGPNPKNGTCVKCDTGEYFDKKDGTCKSAGAYTTTDLQYGKGQTKNTRPEFDDQCWTKAEPSEYEACVNNAQKNN